MIFKYLRITRKVYCIILILLSFFISLEEGNFANAQQNWSLPFEVSSGAGVSWFPDIAVGPENSVHVIWGSGIAKDKELTNNVDLLMYRTFQHGKWSTVNNIAYTGAGGYTVRNSIVFGRDGLLHVLVRMHISTKYISASWEKAFSARSWSAPQSISGDTSYYNALATDNKGGLHALWSEAIIDDPKKPRKNCPNCSDIFYRRSTDGGAIWSTPLNLSQSADGENRPQIKVDSQDRIHVVWDEGVDWYAGKGVPKVGVYRRSDDGGVTWSKPVRFSLPGDAVQQTSLGLSPEGNPVIVYRAVKGNKLYFQYSTDGGTTWNAPTAIPGVIARSINDNNLDTYSLATDSAGHLHLLMVGFRTSDPAEDRNPWLLHLAADANGWSAPEVVMGGDLYPEWPRMVISDGSQLHAVWFTRHKEDLFGSDQGAHYQVWYSSKTLDVPAATAVPLFTPAPTQTSVPPTASPASTPTSTPLPVEALDAPTLSSAPRWEAEGMSTLAIALLPVLGLVALFWSITRRTRRR